MHLPCSCHAVAMQLPCNCHAFAMQLPCYCHAIAVLLPCYCHAIAMLLPCSGHAIPMLLPCYCHAIAMQLPCRWVRAGRRGTCSVPISSIAMPSTISSIPTTSTISTTSNYTTTHATRTFYNINHAALGSRPTNKQIETQIPKQITNERTGAFACALLHNADTSGLLEFNSAPVGCRSARPTLRVRGAISEVQTDTAVTLAARYCHAIAMQFPCICHAVAMPLGARRASRHLQRVRVRVRVRVAMHFPWHTLRQSAGAHLRHSFRDELNREYSFNNLCHFASSISLISFPPLAGRAAGSSISVLLIGRGSALLMELLNAETLGCIVENGLTDNNLRGGSALNKPKELEDAAAGEFSLLSREGELKDAAAG